MSFHGEIEDGGRLQQLFGAIFLMALLAAILSFVLISLTHPHGDYDAVCIWNLRSRFLARGTEDWTSAFVDSLSLPHPDYPLLLPTTVARYWKYVGAQPTLVPIVIAFLFTFSSVGMLYSSLAILRNKQSGYLGGIVLLSVYSFVTVGASQYADVVIGFYILSTFVLLAFYDVARYNSGRLVLAGLTAGLTAWTKNEGLLFVLVVILVKGFHSIFNSRRQPLRRDVIALAGGLFPVLAVLAYFKLRVAPANYYLTAGKFSTAGPMRYFLDSRTVSQKITDMSRYWVITNSMARTTLLLGARIVGAPMLLVAYLILFTKKSNLTKATPPAAMLVLMIVGYFFVYLTTPLNLEFHLRTSLLRVLLQLWPSAVFTTFMATSAAGVKASVDEHASFTPSCAKVA